MRKKSVVIVILALSLVALFAVTAAPALACSPGWYKNHPTQWGDVTINGSDGTQLVVLHSQALAWLRTPVVGDKAYTGFAIVATAVKNGGAVQIQVRDWVIAHPPGIFIAASSAEWQYIESYMMYQASFFD